jgi:hypothetical protein
MENTMYDSAAEEAIGIDPFPPWAFGIADSAIRPKPLEATPDDAICDV